MDAKSLRSNLAFSHGKLISSLRLDPRTRTRRRTVQFSRVILAVLFAYFVAEQVAAQQGSGDSNVLPPLMAPDPDWEAGKTIIPPAIITEEEAPTAAPVQQLPKTPKLGNPAPGEPNSDPFATELGAPVNLGTPAVPEDRTSPASSPPARTRTQYPPSSPAPGPNSPAPSLAPAGPTPAMPPAEECLLEMAAAHDLTVVIGEQFGGRWIASETCDEGPFEDFVLGAQVRGVQKTTARTSLDIVPCRESARVMVVLDGLTNNQSTSYTPQAQIFSRGSYQFQLTKQVDFNGQVFMTRSPSAFLRVEQRHVGAATPMSSVPLLGPLANNIALNQAQMRQPLSQQIAAYRVTQNVAPEFNGRIDEALAKLNEQMEQKVRRFLSTRDLLPTRLKPMSTSNVLLVGADYDGTAEFSATARPSAVYMGPSPPSTLGYGNDSQGPLPLAAPSPSATIEVNRFGTGSLVVPGAEVLRERGVLVLRETFIESVAEKTRLAGLEVTDAALVQFLGQESTLGTGGPEAGQPRFATIVFDEETPLTAKFEQGEILLSLQLTFRPLLGPEIPDQIITVALRPTLTENQITLESDLRSITSANPGTGGGLGTVAESVIREALSQRLPRQTFPRSFEAPREDQPPVPLRIAGLTIRDGWLQLEVESPTPPAEVPGDPGWQPTLAPVAQ